MQSSLFFLLLPTPPYILAYPLSSHTSCGRRCNFFVTLSSSISQWTSRKPVLQDLRLSSLKRKTMLFQVFSSQNCIFASRLFPQYYLLPWTRNKMYYLILNQPSLTKTNTKEANLNCFVICSFKFFIFYSLKFHTCKQ